MEVNYKTIVDISWKDGSMSYLRSRVKKDKLSNRDIRNII